MSNANAANAPASPWGKIPWITPGPVLLHMEHGMAWVVIMGSAGLSVSDPALLDAAEEQLRRGGALLAAPDHPGLMVWEHLGPLYSIAHAVERLLVSEAARVVIAAAPDRQDLADLCSIAPQLSQSVADRVTPALATLGLRVERLSVERLEDRSRWSLDVTAL